MSPRHEEFGPWDHDPHGHHARHGGHMHRGGGHPHGGRGRGRGHHHHQPPGGFGFPPPPPGPPGFGGPGFGPMPPFGGPPFGGPGFGGPGFGGRRGRKARRGDVRSAILSLLSGSPLNGYQIMGAISERSQGAWRPSPGAVYPALQQLTDEGLIEPTGEGRRTLYQLTDSGREYVTEHAAEVEAPWEAMTPQVDEDVWELMTLAQQSASALMQVAYSTGPNGRAKAREILTDTRRKLYQILADGEPAASAPEDDSPEDEPLDDED